MGEDWKTVAEAAAGAGLDERATGVALCALTAAGWVRQDGERFSSEPGVRPYLLAGSPETIVSILNHNLSMMHGWVRLAEVLRTGRPVRGQERTSDELKDFILGMENVSRRSSVEVAGKIDLSGARRLLDLGGGPGTAALTFARANPGLECVVFDLPETVEIAREQIRAADLGDRVRTVAGDFYADSLPEGFDLVYISNIIHMMDPGQTRDLLRKSREALVPGGRVIVKDFFLEDSLSEPAAAAQFSVNMLVNTDGGKSYSRSETESLLAAAGFGDFEFVAVARASGLILGRRLS